jgi:beta-galactosidase
VCLVPRSHNLVQLEIEGPGEIVAVGNGDATSHEPFQAKERSAYNGLCQVIVKGRSGQPGPITLKAKSNGLKDTAISFSSANRQRIANLFPTAHRLLIVASNRQRIA